MCTAISITAGDNYFGRNLDFEYDFGEKIIITPRNFPFNFRNGKTVKNHAAIIGTALSVNNYPLYFDATNENGLSMAGLNFPHFCQYFEKVENKDNVPSFELIPYVLCECKNVDEAKSLLINVNITDEAFDENNKPTPLHFIISDKEKTIVAEQTKDGMKVFDNTVCVLTNSPPFDMQMINLANYMSLSSQKPENKIAEKADLLQYSRGMGAIGLPGDMSSMSRFVRTSFLTSNYQLGETEEEKVNSFFHILYSVYHQKGCVRVDESFEITNYSSCCNTDKGIYYYTTYNNSTINAVAMHNENLDADNLIKYDFIRENKIFIQNDMK